MITVYIENQRGERVGVVSCGDTVFSTGNTGFRGNGKLVVDGVTYQASIMVSRVLKGQPDEVELREAAAARAEAIAKAKAAAEAKATGSKGTTPTQKAVLDNIRSKGK